MQFSVGCYVAASPLILLSPPYGGRGFKGGSFREGLLATHWGERDQDEGGARRFPKLDVALTQ